MAIITIPGDGSAALPDPGLRKYLDVQVLHSGGVPLTARGAEPAAPPRTVDVPNDAIVAVEYADGLKLWMRADDYQAEQAQRTAAARGIRDWAVKVVQAFEFNPSEALGEKIGETTAMQAVSSFENKLSPGPGLYRIDNVFMQSAPIQSAQELQGPGKILLFLHGTASNTQGSFSGLALASGQTQLSILRPTTSEFQRLRKTYNDRILAFEHRTLSQSPIDNVLELLPLLPDRATLHLVSHSRGGLLGELLCLNEELSAVRLQPMYDRQRGEDADKLKKLSRILAAKKFNIERFVRVACPARGTILASKRLDYYLSFILNLAGLIPGFEANPFYECFKASALTLIKMRTEPEKVPGVEAMMPEAPLIHLLNQRDLKSQADLAVIAGDIQGEGVAQRLKVFATDLYYLTRHDLVVDTDSMYCGLGRQKVAHYFFDQGPSVNHFQYFTNGNTRGLLLNWLTRENISDSAGFKELTPANLQLDKSAKRGELPLDAAALIFIPGFLGTQLKDKQGAIWLDFDALALGAYQRLRDADETGTLLGHPYQAIINFMSQHFEVLEFAYDWRKSLNDSLSQLEQLIEKLLEQGRIVHVLSHSSGSFLASAISDQLWARMKGNLVALGGAPDGTYWPVEVIAGHAPIVRQLELLDYAHRVELRAMIADWPGLLETLPSEFFSPQLWAGWEHAPDPASLQLAATVRKSLPARKAIYVAGAAPRTPGVVSGQLDYSKPGDGRVLWESLPKSDVWYVTAMHGELANTPQAFPAILELLQKGTTDKLPQAPPSVALDPSSDVAVLFPDEAELLSAAFGGCVLTEIKPDITTLKVSVLHGDMSKAAYPVMVGHYRGDTIVSAEQRLDTLLDGILSRRFQAGIYPGLLNTTDVILTPEKSPGGAIVVGLGNIGELSEERLRSSVLHAILRFAMTLAEAPPHPIKSYRSASFTAVLIGTYGGEAVDEAGSVTAIVKAALEANRVLHAQKLWDVVRIDEVQFVEIYEDLATQAIHAANRLPEKLRTELARDEQIEVASHLIMSEGGRDRRPSNQYSAGWWRRIQISGQETSTGVDELRFNVLTDRARTEESISTAQTKRVESFVKKAILSPAYDQQITATLFELLLPRSLKRRTNEFANLVLELDSHSAQYPWELLAARSRTEMRPLAANVGLIRQFKTNKAEEPRSTRENRAFVAAFPKIGDGLEFPELLGASLEAEQVRTFLTTGGYAVSPVSTTSTAPQDNYDVFASLFTGDYRILHLAGHGVVNQDGKTGLVIQVDDVFTAEDVRSLPSTPDLVFLNCCHLGSIGLEHANRLAASLAQAFIEEGCRAVVAAGWAVDDQAAVAFAKTFYEQMLLGQNFGKSVLEARITVRKAFPDTNTWGAYQCYGNPDYRIELTGNVNPLRSEDSARTLNELIERCRGLKRESGKTERDLDELLHSVPLEWSTDGRLLAAFGDSFRNFGNFGRAVEMYRQAINDPAAQAPIYTIERLANHEDRNAKSLRRKAVQEGDAGQADLDRGERMIDQAIRRVKWLMIPETEEGEYTGLGESAGRWSMLGGAYRRKALFRAREENLQKARDYYEKAHQIILGQTSIINPYPALNWISLRFLLNEPVEQLKEDLDRITAAAESQAAPHKPFWNRIGRPDAMLTRAMIEGTLPQLRDQIIEAYKNVLSKEGNNQAQVDSITGGVEDLAELVADPASKKALHEIETALRALCE